MPVGHAAAAAYHEAMSRMRFLLLPVLLLWPLVAQIEEKEAKPPDDRKQKEVIARAAYQDSLNDTKKLIAMAEDLKAELEKNDQYVVSVAAIHKTEEIEKLARRIRGRLKE